MKKIILFILFINFQLANSQNLVTEYYLIRHSEKVDASKNPDLSEIGLKRAESWNKILQDVKFDAVFSTDFKRTMQTANPIAHRLNLEIKMYNPNTLDLTEFKKETLGKKVLIVGHSNSTPEFVNKLINQKVYSQIDDTVFGNLYLVTIINDVVTFKLLQLL